VVSAESRVLNFGSVKFGDDPSSTQKSFDNLSAFSRSDYDAWIANLVCHIEIGSGCRDTLADDFKRWFNVVGIGSLGDDSKKSVVTSQALLESSVQFFGKLPSAEKSDSCGVVALPARFRLENTAYRQASLPIVMCGINGEETLSVDLVQYITDSSKLLPVWVYALDETNVSQTVLDNHYRSYIDAGADIVIGVSKDSLGRAENYNGHLIAHSLGRFMGPVPAGQSSDIAALIGVNLSVQRSDNMLAWTEIAKTCSGYNDLCLEAGKSKGLEKLAVEYEYSMKGVSRADSFNPVPADSVQGAEIARTMEWVDVSTSFNEPQDTGI
jgi:hypothetical protein